MSMKILSIETSCDDTGVAVINVQGERIKALANVVSSQQIHAQYGGVFPIMAKREHQNNLVPVATQALKEAKLLITNYQLSISSEKLNVLKKILEKESKLFEFTKTFLETHQKPDIDSIAVTYGPGLEPCLWVGVNFARAVSYFWDIPLIPVNHIEAHILVNYLEHPDIALPAISLVVSGGHTQLILVKKIGQYEIIGETLDDAAGECFDKAARILDLGYPGGPIISKIAANYTLNAKRSTLTLPRPMMHSKDYNFSFSGLKTAVLYKVRDEKMTEQFKNELCVAVQEAIVDVLIKKTLQAAKDFKAKTIILGGGVSANQQLREEFTQQSPISVIFPEPKLSTDNGLMIAVAGYFNRAKKIAWQKLSAQANLRVGTN